MKQRFSTLDIIAILPELKSKLCTGWRVNQVYDVDYKTYLFKLNKSIIQMKKDDDPLSVKEETANKMTFIIESGLRMHTTDYDWPKSPAPSGFATKLRKALRNKRIEDIRQVGIDRLIDIQFGSNQAANHLIVELYDRGNLILTDNIYTILAILRWRRPTPNDKPLNKQELDDSENFKVGQIYPLEKSRKLEDLTPMTEKYICQMLRESKTLLGSNQNYKKRNKAQQRRDDGLLEVNLKDLFNPHVIYGSSLLEDKLLKHLSSNEKQLNKCVIQIPSDGKKLDENVIKSYSKVIKAALDEADNVLKEVTVRTSSPGFIVQKKLKSDPMKSHETKEEKMKNQGKDIDIKLLTTNIDFFPIRSCADRKIDQEPSDLVCEEYESFDKAVDVYYCSMESQKLDSKAFVAEKEARKKLENLKISQEKRLEDLARVQKDDEEKARLIEINNDKVEQALLIIRSMLANQVPWKDIWDTVKAAQAMNDPIACLITGVKFDRNEFSMKLGDPYDSDVGEDDQTDQHNSLNKKNRKQAPENQKSKSKIVDIDIGLSAYANARRFFVKRRTAVMKEKKTIEVSKKAFKNVERRTKEMLKEVVVKTNITKARKRYWFENFFWFISSDGYLVVAGRDAEQNELLVKRYMKNNDVYVHADLHGASSVIIKNEFSEPVPPKTLVEAGSMAVCYSSAWDSKIATTAWWVYPKQVSKTAPAGEYLTLGAFIIRGKKNYLPLSTLVLGFGFLFRLGEESIDRRKEERIAKESTLMAREQLKSDQQENHVTSEHSEVAGSSDDQSLEEQDSDSEEKSKADKLAEHDHKSDVEEPHDEQEVTDDMIHDDEILEDDDDLDEVSSKLDEHRLVDTLTEAPVTDDVLLYGLPMCGPYSAFQSFKYKVKVVPGANKRGKAAKTCLGMFMHDKRATQREKDLLRALKDQDYARNIPNKVKISATNLMTITKKRPKKSEVRLPM